MSYKYVGTAYDVNAVLDTDPLTSGECSICKCERLTLSNLTIWVAGSIAQTFKTCSLCNLAIARMYESSPQ